MNFPQGTIVEDTENNCVERIEKAKGRILSVSKNFWDLKNVQCSTVIKSEFNYSPWKGSSLKLGGKQLINFRMYLNCLRDLLQVPFLSKLK